MEVLPANWDSVTAFLACETQWRIVAPTFSPLIRTGLDYAGIDIVLRRRKVADDVFADIQIMERAAIAAFSEVKDG